MSTKTTFKRIALVTVAALGFGVLTSVAPASAQVSQSIAAYVGPNGATSLTVVGGDTTTAGALVRIDVTSNETTTPGLALNETVTASVTVAPALRNAGSVVDTSTAVGGAGSLARSDFVVINSGGNAANTQTSGSGATLSTDIVSGVTNWTKLASGATAAANVDSATPAAADNAAAGQSAARGAIGSLNRFSTRMDGNRTTTLGGTVISSYYVTVAPRNGSDVYDKGAYTFSFQLTDAAGVVRGTTTVKIDFVSSAAKSDAVVELASSGTFLKSATLASYDSTSAAYATLKLTNRDGGLVRGWDGRNVAPSAAIQWIRTSAVTSDTVTLTVNDSGTYGSDFGTQTAYLGAGSLRGQDGIFGLTGTLPSLASATGNTYQFWGAYGNAAIKTLALTVFEANGSGSASTVDTDVQVTAVGMSEADQLKISDQSDSAHTWTLPTTTQTASVKFWIQDSTDTPTGLAAITVKPTWSGAHGTTLVTPATSTTGTVYTTDAQGNFTVTVTNSAPVAGATLTLVASGGLAFGAGTYTATLTWATAVASTITTIEPVQGIHVLAGSTNVTTVVVKDQFGNKLKDQVVTASVTATPATTPATVITPLTTDANGAVQFSYTAAATTTSAALSFNTVPAVTTAATAAYTYKATLPVVSTMVAYYGLDWGAAATLTPSAGIYSSGTTRLAIVDARDLTAMASGNDADDLNDQIAMRFTGLTSAAVAAEGAAVTVTAGTGGHILDALGAPVKSRVYPILSTGSTDVINVLATGTGAITFTATSGAVTVTASMWVAGRTDTAGRFVTVTAAKTGTANGTGVPVTVAVTDRYGNAVSNVAVNVVATGVGSFMGGNITQSFTTDAAGTYTFLANTTVSDGGVAKFTATTGNLAAGFSSAAGKVGSTTVDAALAAGNTSASAEITFAAGASAADIAQAAADAAAEAIDAGNNAYDAANAAADAADAATAAAQQAGEDAVAAAEAAGAAAVEAAQSAQDAAAEATDAATAATDAANAAAEAADAATAAAQDAADAVAALSTQVAEMVSALKKQITALTNLVIKIQKKVKA